MKKDVFLVSFFFLLLTACSNANEKMPSSKIYFWSDRGGQQQIYMMNPDGSDQQKISNFPNWDFSYSNQLSPNHKYLAIVHEKDQIYSIFVLTLDGKIVGSAFNYNTYDDMPNWSPDSKYIAFYSTRDGSREIYSMKYDGTEIKRLTNNPSYDNVCPVWSLDGKKIAFQSGQMGGFGGFIMNSDGSNVQSIGKSTTGTGYYCPPVSWSPDSQRIGMFGSVIINLEEPVSSGFHTINIISPDLYWSYYQSIIPPVWSPDGKKILFEVDESSSETRNPHEIFVVGIDGTMLMKLTNDDMANNSNPLWSPDGQYIAFQSDRTGKYQIYRMKPDGSNLVRLTNDSANDTLIDWK